MKSRDQINGLKQLLQDLESEESGPKDFKTIYETQKVLKRLYTPILVCTKPPKTHQSVVKVASVLELKTLFIEPKEDGSMDTQDLLGKLTEMKDQPHFNFIVNVNFGTTTGAAFDDVFEIRKVFDEVKNEGWRYTVHMDAALYGPTLPILKQYGEKSNSLKECGVDTVTISLWKFLGVQVPCGVALSTKEFTDKAFEDDNFIEYVQMQDKLALVGTRSGIAAASALNVMKTLKMHENNDILKNMVDYDLELATYLEDKLKLFFKPEDIKRIYFNVIFPKPAALPDLTIGKYLLMRVGTTHLQAITLINVSKGLIDEFIEEFKLYVPLLDQQDQQSEI